MLRLPGRKHRSQETLSEYLDNRLSPGERRKIELHLDSCRRCSEDLESLRATVDLLQRVPTVQPRRSFVLAELPHEAVAPARRTLPNWAVGLATSAAMLAFVAVLSTDLTGALATKQASDGLEAPQTAVTAESDVTTELAAPPPALEQNGEANKAFATPKEALPQESRAEELLPPEGQTATEGLGMEQGEKRVQPEAATSQGLAPPAEEPTPESSAETALGAPLPGEASTPTYWRVVEGVLGGLAALLAGAFVWRRRRDGAL